ncbi:hypothetical protein PWT90_09543 [Aphanocladium album]|nr:hypothetical protein PWT90_09543 [Aphanocladium album]
MQAAEWMERNVPRDALDEDSYQQYLERFAQLSSLGLNLSTISLQDLDEPGKVEKLLGELPAMKLALELHPGLDMMQPREAVLRVSGRSSSSMEQDPAKFHKAIDKRRNSIRQSWIDLRELKRTKKLSEFQAEWSRITELERREWLQQTFPRLPQNAQSGLHAWLENLHSSRPPIGNLFIYRLLNIDLLARDNILPDLLDFRATLHPAYLLDLDGSSVNLGVVCGSLPSIRVPGVLKMPLEQAGEQYDFAYVEAAAMPDMAFQDYLPTAGLHKLNAQQNIYEWLVNIVKSVQRLPKPKVELSNGLCRGFTKGSDSVPVLTRSLLADYQMTHNRISIAYLHSLVLSALDEALFDLAQARKYPDMWQEQLQGSDWVQVCRTWFARVDVFSLLAAHSDSLQQKEGREIVLTGNDTSFRALCACFWLCNSLVKEVLSQLPSARRWSPDKMGSPVLSELFKLLQEGYLLPYIPLIDVLMAIDTEIRKCESTAHVPERVTKVLHDLSVLAACIRELQKHYRFAKDNESYGCMLGELKEEREKTKRPRTVLVEAALKRVGEKEPRLKTHIRDKTIDLATRHSNFWTVFDNALEKCSADTTMKWVVDELLESQPVDSAISADCRQTVSFGEATQPVEPTATQINKSKRRNRNHHTCRPRALPAASEPLHSHKPLPVVKLHTELEFWDSILAQSAESRTDLTWHDFCVAMAGIGFGRESVIGSAFRFRSEAYDVTLVFRKPHPTASLPHTLARRYWLDKLTGCLDLQRGA